MGLYLTVFDGDEELDGLEIGSYADFGIFRDAVTQHLEGGKLGSRFPTLVLHSDCDGLWSPTDSARLENELQEIAVAFRGLPPVEFGPDTWQGKVAKVMGLELRSLYDCFFDVDGEPLIGRLIELAQTSQRLGKDILFQ